MSVADWIGIVGVGATIIVAYLQWLLAERVRLLSEKVKSGKWEAARAAFYTDCFILSGDLLNVVVRHTKINNNRTYICENMEFPLHEIVNRTDHIYGQARTISTAFSDSESADLSNIMNILRFSSNSARDALRSWSEIEDLLPLFKSVETDHDAYLVPVAPVKRDNPLRNRDICGKNFEGFGISFRECCVRLRAACDEFYTFTMNHTNGGREIESLFPPEWILGIGGRQVAFQSFKEEIQRQLKILDDRIKLMDERGLCFIKYPDNRPEL